jgi:biotin transport system substrate-specific component
MLAFAGSWLVAGLAQIEIKLPFTPVPITGQTLGVLLVGASLGTGLGAASMLLYLAQGALGLPFFSEGGSGAEFLRLSAVTGGYLWGFVAAAAVVGALAERKWDRTVRSSIGAMFLGEVVLYAIAIPWLMQALDVPLGKALELGSRRSSWATRSSCWRRRDCCRSRGAWCAAGPSAGRRSARTARASRTGARPRRSEPSPNATASPSSTWWRRPASTSRR